MKNNEHCQVKLAKYRACILSATLVSPLLLVAIIYTQADAQNPTQTASVTVASQKTTTTTTVAPAIVDKSEQEHDTDNISYGFEALQNSFANESFVRKLFELNFEMATSQHGFG